MCVILDVHWSEKGGLCACQDTSLDLRGVIDMFVSRVVLNISYSATDIGRESRSLFSIKRNVLFP